MSKITIKSIGKLVFSATAAVLGVVLCAPVFPPLAICAAVCGVIIVGFEVYELVQSYFVHEDAVVNTHIDHIVHNNTANGNHVDSQSQGTTDHDDTIHNSIVSNDSTIGVDVASEYCIVVPLGSSVTVEISE